MTLAQLHAVLGTVADRRVDPSRPVYRLRAGLLPFSRRTRSLPQRRERALSALREVGWPVFATTPVDPRERPLHGTFVQPAAQTWLVPPEPATRALLGHWLAGAYRLYLAQEPVDSHALPDLFRGRISDALAYLEGHGIAALLEAVQSRGEWRILVQPGAVPVLAAA